MVARSFITVVWTGFIFALASCSDRRPEVTEAKADFSRLYPAAEIVSVRVSEDEVIARSFAITYRHPGQSETRTLEIQYVKNDQGVYKLAPAPPSELP
jgi:hypothetical protein